MRFQRAGPTERPVAPHLAEQLLLRPHAVRLRRELRDELELLRRQEHRRVADVDAPRRPVDDEVAGDDDVLGGAGAVARISARMRASSSS